MTVVEVFHGIVGQELEQAIHHVNHLPLHQVKGVLELALEEQGVVLLLIQGLQVQGFFEERNKLQFCKLLQGNVFLVHFFGQTVQTLKVEKDLKKTLVVVDLGALVEGDVFGQLVHHFVHELSQSLDDQLGLFIDVSNIDGISARFHQRQ